MEKISWQEIENMSLENLIEKEEFLPDEIDIKNLNEDNFEDFKKWIYLLEEEKEDEEYVEKETSTIDKKFCKSLFLGYASMPGMVIAHELFHALGAKSTGGTVHNLNFGMDSSGFYGYVSASTPNIISYTITGALPTLAIVPASTYLLKKGIDDKDLKYSGVGWAGLFLHIDSFLYPGGDFYEIAAAISENVYLPSSDISNVLLGGILLSSIYATSYSVMKKWEDIKSTTKKLYEKIKR